MTDSKKIILASASPRRKELLEASGIKFIVKVRYVSEDYPSELKKEKVAEYIASKKADAYDEEVSNGCIVITADTVVCCDDKILGKPEDYNEAFNMLRLLSGKSHEVITAVCIRYLHKRSLFNCKTLVEFRQLTDEEIDYYITTFKPFDKAGGYGIQEWIGHVAITSINGSYDNVVGLPVSVLYSELQKLTSL